MDKPSRTQLEQAVDDLNRTAQPGSENARFEAILLLAKADPQDQTTREFIQQFETKRGRPVG